MKIKILNFIFCVSILFSIFAGLVFVSPNVSSAQVLQVRIIYNEAPIYDRADFLDLTSQQRQESIIKKATLHEVYDVQEVLENIYKITVEQEVGYILKSMVVDNSVSSPEKQINYNAEVITDCFLYEKVGENFNQTQTTLKSGDKVCILDGYDQDKQYTLVCFYDNENLTNLYIKTEVLKVKGINPTLIVSISVIVAGCTIAVILAKLFLGKKSKVKK